jgi:hypothetical protein
MSEQQASQSETSQHAHGERCVCNEVFDHVRDLFGVPPAAKEHLANSRIEFLKAIRSVIDARIERVSKSASQGTRIAVE